MRERIEEDSSFHLLCTSSPVTGDIEDMDSSETLHGPLYDDDITYPTTDLVCPSLLGVQDSILEERPEDDEVWCENGIGIGGEGSDIDMDSKGELKEPGDLMSESESESESRSTSSDATTQPSWQLPYNCAPSEITLPHGMEGSLIVLDD